MSENNLYYIYIDSKIKGTINQLISYFQSDIFNADDCICIYFKYYKDIEYYIHKKFSHTSIKFKFIRKNSDFEFQSNKIVFYLFNAQSNCRVVAQRDLTHIFVTHGESHKLASIKPIIRIYDFVITSGQMGVDRFLKAGIFNSENVVKEFRVIPMGDTFIGQSFYRFDLHSKSLVYAPTWEGGVPNENYSSIGLKAIGVITALISKYAIHTLYIQPHPNLGHRDKVYLSYLKQMVKALRQHSVNVVLVQAKISWLERLLYRDCQIVSFRDGLCLEVSAAVVDISAMEMQLISQDIPTLVLFKQDTIIDLIIPKRVQCLYDIKNSLENLNVDHFDFIKHRSEVQKRKDYLLSFYEQGLSQLSFRQRVKWLCTFATDRKNRQLKESSEIN